MPFTSHNTKSKVGNLFLGNSSGASVVNFRFLFTAFIAGWHILAILMFGGSFLSKSILYSSVSITNSILLSSNLIPSLNMVDPCLPSSTYPFMSGSLRPAFNRIMEYLLAQLCITIRAAHMVTLAPIGPPDCWW